MARPDRQRWLRHLAALLAFAVALPFAVWLAFASTPKAILATLHFSQAVLAQRWTRTQRIGLPLAALSRIGASAGLVRATSRWQFMHVCVGGTWATAEVSTEAWQ